mgnify:CR=1 FL=1
MNTSNYLLHGLVLQTKDQDEAALCMSGAAIPYVSELLPGSPPFSTQIFATSGQRVDLTRVVTCGAMRVKATLPDDSYAIILDLRRGLGPHRFEKTIVPVGPDFAFVQSPLQDVEVETTSSFEALFLRISRDGLMEELERLLGREARSELTFSPEMRLATAAGRQLRILCDSLRRTLYSTASQNVRNSPELRKIEGDLIALLLQAQPHNYRRFLHRSSAAGPWQIRAAEEFMRSNAHLPISLGDVCKAAGVNARTLQDSFQKKRKCTPMEFLRNVRMEEARTGLLHPDANTSVTREAARWGFLHFGRFSRDYQVRYHELPSETLRRARRSGMPIVNGTPELP